MGMFKLLSESLGFSKRKARILVIGLDNSGKTTLINHLKPKKAIVNEVVPTIGFQVEEFSKSNISFTVFDMSGQSNYRGLWEKYYPDVEAIVWVVDSTDKVRMCVVRDELETMLHHKEIHSRNIPFLFFANKMDLPNGLSPVEVMQLLELQAIPDKPWHISASNALSGSGVDEGIDWLAENLRKSSGRK